MKVRDFADKASNVNESRGREERKVPEVKSAGFQNKLIQVESANFEEHVKDMVDKIIEQGEKLSNKVDIRELKVYKKMISEFLDEVVANSHKFSKQSFLDRRGRYKVYAVIKKINQELDLITKDILNDEKDNIQVLQRIDDIRGLILDITM
ncbi:MAG: YaaR family protein [Bacillota bacterium]|nr:YaaR family protein [Bacillota bacterium]